jgi:hypothetical protein
MSCHGRVTELSFSLSLSTKHSLEQSVDMLPFASDGVFSRLVSKYGGAWNLILSSRSWCGRSHTAA